MPITIEEILASTNITYRLFINRYVSVCIYVYLGSDLKLLGFRHDSLWDSIFHLYDVGQRRKMLLKDFTALVFCIPRSVWVRKRPEHATGSGRSYFVSQGTLEGHTLGGLCGC